MSNGIASLDPDDPEGSVFRSFPRAHPFGNLALPMNIRQLAADVIGKQFRERLGLESLGSLIGEREITEADLRNNFSKLSWKDAEDLVGELFKEKGYKIEVGVLSESGEQKRSGDFGIDVRAKNSNESIGIQVKHWTENVKSEDVAKTIGYADPFDKVIIISTKSDFTAQTYTAKNEGQFKKAELWNTDKFKDEIRTHILIEKQ